MISGLFKIYYIEYDEGHQEIGRGVYHKEYKDWGWAHSIARKRYGDINRFKYIVAQRDPWVEYSKESVCHICGATYNRPEHFTYRDMGLNVDLYDSSKTWKENRHRRLDVCPDCFEKVNNFVDSLIYKPEE